MDAISSASNWFYPAPDNIVMSFLEKVYSKVILTPLAKLYLWGPAVGGWGFWNGIETHDICTQKTTIAAEFWKDHPEECIELIGKHFYSIVITIQTIVYFIILTWISKLVINVILLLCQSCYRYCYRSYSRKCHDKF